MPEVSNDWYATPHYYDVAFQTLNQQEVRFLDEMCEEAKSGDTCRILEPACGSGRLMLGLAERGHHVEGFDLSPEMVEYARKRLREYQARIEVANMTDFDMGDGFDIAHCLVNTFKYLPTDKAALEHLRRMRRTVRRGGFYVLGMHVSEYHDRRSSSESWHGKDGALEVFCTIDSGPANRRARTEQMCSKIRVTRPGKPDDRVETHWDFRTYSAAELRGLVARAAGWRLVSVHDFDYNWDKEVPMQGDRLDRILLLQRI